jgi:PAS domain S-box-containing protein
MATDPGVYRQIVESSLDGLWLVDAHGRTVFANRRVAELLGRTEDEIDAIGLADVLDDDERPCFEAHLDDLARGGLTDRRGTERTFRRPDGTPVPLLVTEQVLHDEAGQVVGYVHRLTDDSRRRALVDALSRSESQLAEAQAIARIGSWEIHTDPHEVTWSRQMYELLDVDPETFEAGPDTFIGQIVDEDRESVAEEWARLAIDPGERTVDARVRLRDGSSRWVRTVGRVLEVSADGTPRRFGGTVQDIHDLKETELRLRDAVQLNVLMQFMATAANETTTLDDALRRLRDLLLADDDWEKGVAFSVTPDGLRSRPLDPGDRDTSTTLEADVAARALTQCATVVEEQSLPGWIVVGFPVLADGVPVVVVVVTARTPLPHRAEIESVVGQVAAQLGHVAARERLVDELTRSQSQLAEAQAIARVGSWDIRLEPYESTWSAQLYELLGVDPATFVPGLEEFLECVVESDRQLLTETWEEIVLSPVERSVDVRIRRPDGEERWVRAVGRVLEWAPDGAALRVSGTVQDIQELKESELQLRDAVELNTLMQFVATTVNETNTLDETLARTRELLLAHPDWERGVAFDVTDDVVRFRPVGPDDPTRPTELETEVAARALAAGGTVFEEEAVPDKPLLAFPVVLDGTPRLVLVITNRSPFVRHEMMRLLVAQVAAQIAHVAAREAAATELAAARDLAMAASQAKSDFLATMSHEIRTPLNGVIGLNDLLLRTELDPHQRQLAEAMQGAGRALLSLISDILDFSKIEAGGLELEAVAFQPAVVVQGTLELFAPMAAAKGIDLTVEIDDDVPERLDGDPGRFGQVLSNLVANAVKFTHEGGVRVHVSGTTKARAVTLRVEVADTGIGMDAEQQGRIFQPFRQADASTTRNFGGTGLGLAIAHRLAAALGGEIGVTSEPGVGSTFWFTGEFQVPRSRPRVSARAVPNVTEPRTGGHVLVVEDNEVNQLVAVGMLEVLGYTSEVAADGAAAAARAAGGRFDAVLMDLQMPRLDGFAATRLIRQAEAPGVRVPIIALTASATAGEQERCLAAGMTGFLSKPVEVDALGRVLREQLAPGTVGGSTNGTVHAPANGTVHRPTNGATNGASRPGVTRGVVPVLDEHRLEELAEMGAAALPLIQRAIDNFVDGAADHVDALRSALTSADAEALRSAAHRLKGSAANLGALRVADLALHLEELGRTGQLDGAEDLLDRLVAALDEATASLTAYHLVAVAEQAS